MIKSKINPPSSTHGIPKLIAQLKKNIIKSASNFRTYFKYYLPIHSITAIAIEKMTIVIPALIHPFTSTGIGKRELISHFVTEYKKDKNSPSLPQQTFDAFNLSNPNPYENLALNNCQRQILIEMLENPSTPIELLKNLKSVGIKYLTQDYTLAELSQEERQAIDEINFKVTGTHLSHLLHVFNDPNSPIFKHAQSEKHYHYVNALIAEMLSKTLAYNPEIDGRRIDIPVDINGQMKFVTYQIKKHYLGDGLPLYAFEPSQNAPNIGANYATPAEIKTHANVWVTIRGTEVLVKEDKEGALESIAADLKDPDGVSSLPIWQKSAYFLNLFSKLTADGKKINMTGHSLGGSLAQSMSVIFNPFIDQTFAFNSPGVDKQIHDFYEQLESPQKNNIKVFHCAGDIVSSASPKRIGQNFEIHPSYETGEKPNFLQKHSNLLLHTSHKQYHVNVSKDENNLMRRFADWSRRHLLSKVTHFIGQMDTFTWFSSRKELKSFSQAYFERLQALNSKDTEEKVLNPKANYANPNPKTLKDLFRN